MKKRLENILFEAVQQLKKQAVIEESVEVKILVERARDPKHGDYASNLALVLAKPARKNPRELADLIIALLNEDSSIEKMEVAGPGFINFFMTANAQNSIIQSVLNEGKSFGRSQVGAGKRVQVEYVSANPTGPLHVGHGRGAAYGSTVSNLLKAVGYDVHQEYYVNDAGRQMDILATSVWLRYQEALGEQFDFPSNGYKGDYVKSIAEQLVTQHTKQYQVAAAEILANLPADEPAGGDKEVFIDAMIDKAKNLLGSEAYEVFFQAGLTSILEDIKQDLGEFGVHHDEWFSERSLVESSAIDDALKRLDESGYLYRKDGALWFKSSDLGDVKDRVVERENGQKTYFASDIAYHMNKLDRGYDRLVNIWGADHHGYIPRVNAAIQALGEDASKLNVLLVQFAVLYRGTEKVQMSTRSGEFVTLRQLRDEVGNDAARFFYVMRKSEQHMDFDLELATSKSNENPVYYVQYAHARICSVFNQLGEKGLQHDVEQGNDQLELLTTTNELTLISTLARYAEVLEKAADQYEPHQLINYLRELANDFHAYYNAHQFIVEDQNLCNARLNLVKAVKQVIQNGLEILGISAPEAM